MSKEGHFGLVAQSLWLTEGRQWNPPTRLREQQTCSLRSVSAAILDRVSHIENTNSIPGYVNLFMYSSHMQSHDHGHAGHMQSHDSHLQKFLVGMDKS